MCVCVCVYVYMYKGYIKDCQKYFVCNAVGLMDSMNVNSVTDLNGCVSEWHLGSHGNCQCSVIFHFLRPDKNLSTMI